MHQTLHDQQLATYRTWYDQFVERHYPTFRETWQILDELGQETIQPDDVILNIGAGHSSRLEKNFHRAKKIYALDPDQTALSHNTHADEKLVGYVEAIPLPANSVDVVILEWVMEHVADPKAAVREISRVLRPGGRIIFATPNILGPVMVGLAGLKRISEPLSQWLIGRFLKELSHHDVYPAYYRWNSLKRIQNLFQEHDIDLVRLETTGNPGYFRLTAPSLWLALQWEKISAIPSLKWTQAYLLGVGQKQQVERTSN